MRFFWFALAVQLVEFSPAAHAFAAEVEVLIDLSEQRMMVEVGGENSYSWLVSTARRGYRTPIGHFQPTRLERTWFSTRYDLSPMPYSIFFRGGYAIHGTKEIGKLGRPVSHGCVRLHPANAHRLFELVRLYGKGATEITIRP
ncbi:L,D-transpeptidase [Mesorhizobium qingshengii]|uniref:L,D-transpeptidase n=1 Tax=Mesorhizobium qingshengii TaxID=1165689 RepID=UPI001FCDC976|nr:L,D-transpeptidase [Mesorhizobium qingshengii]